MSSYLLKFEFFIGMMLLSVITFLVFIAAIMRFTGHPVIWSIDLAQLLFIWLCFLGAVRAMRIRAHLGVDYLVRKLSHQNRLIIESVMAVIFIAVMAVLAVEGYKLSVLNQQRIFGDSGISYFFVTIAVPVGCFFLSLTIILNSIEAWRSRGSKNAVYIFVPALSTVAVASDDANQS